MNPELSENVIKKAFEATSDEFSDINEVSGVEEEEDLN